MPSGMTTMVMRRMRECRSAICTAGVVDCGRCAHGVAGRGVDACRRKLKDFFLPFASSFDTSEPSLYILSKFPASLFPSSVCRGSITGPQGSADLPITRVVEMHTGESSMHPACQLSNELSAQRDDTLVKRHWFAEPAVTMCSAASVYHLSDSLIGRIQQR